MTRFVTMAAILLPFLEIPGFVLVSHWIGVVPMLALVLGGAIAGILVLQRVGLNAVVSLRLALARGEEPGHTLIDAACFALGGFLLTIPGFISDFVAFALFLPPTRNYFLRRMARHFDTTVHIRTASPQGSPRGSPAGRHGAAIIEGEYSVLDSDDRPGADAESKE